METQDGIMSLLLANQQRVAPWIEREIWNFDQCYSGYKKDAEQVTEEDKKFIEDSFRKIFDYVETQYACNERKLYHTILERLRYRVSEWKHKQK